MATTEPAGGPFEFSAGALCLDFANTLGDRAHARQEQLPDPAALLAWVRAAGLVPAARAAALARDASRRPGGGRAALARALTLREALYRLFAALACGREPDAADLAVLNRWLARSLGDAQVTPAGRRRFAWTWTPPAAIEDCLRPVARSAADLLTSDESDAVRECAAASCSWLFVDRSRTRRRRWCDMTVCGNRAKARRHYARRKRTRRPRAASAPARPAGD